jgi:hypothetical protein
MVTHSSTSRPVQCLCMAERTGCPVLTDLWSYVLDCCALAHSETTNVAERLLDCYQGTSEQHRAS